MKDPRQYLSKPYSRVLIPDEETGTFTALLLEFPGCIAEGKNPAEAYERLEAAAESWIEASLDLGQDIPEPSASQSASGKVLVRLQKSLHKQASDLACREGTSLNQFIVAAVAEKVGATNLYHQLIANLEAKSAAVYSSSYIQNFSLSQTNIEKALSSQGPRGYYFISDQDTITPSTGLPSNRMKGRRLHG